MDLDLLGLRFANGGLLIRGGLGHARVALAASRLLLADELHVTRLVADGLDGERVDLQAGRGEVALGRVLDGLLELLAVEVELLDGERADDRAQRALEHVLDDGVDGLLLGLEEPFRRVADGLVVGTDLERRDTLHRDLDALAGDGVGEVDVDLPRGELELADLMDEWQDDHAATAHDLEVAPPVRRPVALTGHDQRLVRPGDLVATADVADDQDDHDDGQEDREDSSADEVEEPVKHRSVPRFLWWSAVGRARPAVGWPGRPAVGWPARPAPPLVRRSDRDRPHP
jgi:hypothetical protein